MIMAKHQNHSLSLRKLINNIEGLGVWDLALGKPAPIPNIEITGITQDSRQVKPGYLFAALKGVASNGAYFIPMAIEKGAVAILVEEEGIKGLRKKGIKEALSSSLTPSSLIPFFITSPNPKLALAHIAANFYQKQPEVIAAVTGTNGKTSTAFFCTQLWQLLNKKSASIGTIGIATADGLAYEATGSMTTPDPIKLHEILANLESDGITHLAMEASSHGLDQYRLDGVNIKAAAFSNITRDHLDYHGTFEKYLEAKLRLFEVMKDGVAIINADIPESQQIIDLCNKRGHKVLSIGKKGKYIELFDITQTSLGQQIAFEVLGKLYTVNTPLIGEFQAYNLLTALALVVACGANIDEAVHVLDKVQAVPGRMQGVSGIRYQVSGDRDKLPETCNLKPDTSIARIYVDYAHTPDALEKALNVLVPYAKGGKLWVIFGCGGDRDKGKRPQMGAVAAKIADRVVITDDNPRSEVPETIRAEIIAACPNAIEIGDRHEAIAYAVRNMEENDILLIAGKGHEKTQTIGDKKFAFDDVKVAEEILGKK